MQAQQTKALEAKKRDQAIQIALNTVLQESQLALALSEIIDNATTFGLAFLFIVGAEVATMFAVFSSGVTQIAFLPKYHDGDEITPQTALNRSRGGGGKKSNEIDIRAEIGEGVIRKESYQDNKGLYRRLNRLERAVNATDLASILNSVGVVIPESVRQRDLLLIHQSNEAKAQHHLIGSYTTGLMK